MERKNEMLKAGKTQVLFYAKEPINEKVGLGEVVNSGSLEFAKGTTIYYPLGESIELKAKDCLTDQIRTYNVIKVHLILCFEQSVKTNDSCSVGIPFGGMDSYTCT